MKKAFIVFSVILAATSCIRVNQNPVPDVNIEAQATTDGIFIHVKQGADHAHDVLMALGMANKFAGDYDLLMYFDIDGIEMVKDGAPNLKMEPFGSSDELFKQLVDKGITIFACPSCMKVAGVSPSELRSGVTVADKDMFFDFTDGRILSIDY